MPKYFEFTIDYLENLNNIEALLSEEEQVKPKKNIIIEEEVKINMQRFQTSKNSNSYATCKADKDNTESKQNQILEEKNSNDEKNGSVPLKQLKFTEKTKPLYVKRERFLSEDNNHPTYQIINFQNLLLQDEYFSTPNALQQNQKTSDYRFCNSTVNKNTFFFNTEPKHKNSSSNTNNKNNNIIKKESLNNNNLKSCINNINNAKNNNEKESTSRESTEMKSQLKSKNLDFLPEEEASDVSFELDFYCKGISEENSEKECYEDAESEKSFQKNHQKEMSNFSLDDVVSKAKALKDMLTGKNCDQIQK